MRSIPRRSAVLSAALAAALSAARVAADAPADSPELAYFDEVPVVLAGSRLAQRLDASPVAVSIIDRQMIEASGAREIEDLLRLAPGMIVGHHDGSTAYVTYHAIADRFARRMQVLIDGRSVYSPAFGGVDWSTLPLTVDDIERIEVVRGPNAAAYGANAYLGTISITTRRAARPHGVELVGRGGQGDVADGRVTAEHVAERWSARVTASQWGDDGFEPLNRWLDSERTNLVNGRLDLDLGAGQTLLLEAGASDGWRSAGRPSRRPDPPHDRYTASRFWNLRWSDALSADSTLSVALYDSVDETDERYKTLTYVAPPILAGTVGTVDYSAESHRTDLEVQHVVRLDESLRVVYGGSARLDRVVSPGWLGTTAERDNNLYRAFAHAEWQASARWLLNAGVMFEDTEFTDPGIDPRVAATYSLAPGHTLRVGASQASRTPVIVEQFADQSITYDPGAVVNQMLLSSNTLESESIRSWEVAYLGSFPGQRLLLDVRAFHDELDDLITYVFAPYADLDGFVQDFANTDRAAMHGVETQVDWRPTDVWRLVANYSYNHYEATNVAERYGTATPTQVASVLALRRFGGGLEASIGAYWRTRFDGLDTLDRVPEHARVDLRVKAPIGPADADAWLELVVQGAEGAHLDSRDDMQFEPRAYLELGVRF